MAESDARTEAVRLDPAIRANEERLRALIASAQDAVVIMDTNGLVVDWNPCAERLFGWSAEEAIGARLSELIVPPALRAQHEKGLRRYVETREGHIVGRSVELTAVSRGGHEIPIELSLWPLESGGDLLFGAFIHDIYSRKAAEHALREQEEKYRLVVENGSEGILVVREARIVFANPATERLIGVPLTVMQAVPFTNWIHPDDRAMVVDRHLRRLRGEPVDAQYAFRVLRPDGTILWVELSAVSIQWEGEQATLSFITDITHRKRVEEDMQRNLQREKELNQLKSRFVSMTSHEFRTPLAGILSSSELIRHYSDRLPPNELAELFEQIEDSVERMTQMLDNILLIGRADAQGLKFRPARIDLEALCRELAEEVTRSRNSGDGRPTLRIDFANTAGEHWMDPTLLRHILGNLLSNAFKYSPSGGEVRFEVRIADDQLHFEVADQGIGIPFEDQAKLFETFHRASNVGNISGTGLGLAIVKQSVDLHGGRIILDSEPGRGSCFKVDIPIGKEQASE